MQYYSDHKHLVNHGRKEVGLRDPLSTTFFSALPCAKYLWNEPNLGSTQIEIC